MGAILGNGPAPLGTRLPSPMSEAPRRESGEGGEGNAIVVRVYSGLAAFWSETIADRDAKRNVTSDQLTSIVSSAIICPGKVAGEISP